MTGICRCACAVVALARRSRKHDSSRPASKGPRKRDSPSSLRPDSVIAPDDQDSLFELFVLFRFVATLERLRESQPEYKTIATGRQEVARFEDDTEIVLYHDNSAGDRNLSFVAEPDEDATHLSRTDKVQLEAQEIAGDYFERDFRNHTGRPDVIVLEVIAEDDDQHEYLIVEVKNSTNVDTIRRGSRRRSSTSHSSGSTRSTSSVPTKRTTSARGGTGSSSSRTATTSRPRSRSSLRIR
ncbi:hypothetical protein Htur_1596 [Haloterrigena turkmenica DSM 5511]|uniref:Uncharacterized protein n=1 Tax=Haloterrigena turkmenica (strain ATCC 51198 / DSM 5511 / JCM 9101 / NCIMB 13204 / VKM B-1734 / 4k) TaxID=543526 RepID=D2RRC2_HALTV|nr:hypothetical protein Htur_1596 [Haloterrigena turkmenica DSM 5511]